MYNKGVVVWNVITNHMCNYLILPQQSQLRSCADLVDSYAITMINVINKAINVEDG